MFKKYHTRGEFLNNDRNKYEAARSYGWLDEMTRLTTDINKFPHSCYVVYSYTDESAKKAYVGLTTNKKERHIAHSTGMRRGRKATSPIWNYFNSMGSSVPDPNYLEENVNADYARERENYWCEYYKAQGYSLLNNGKTGRATGTLGTYAKRTKEAVFEESRKYGTITEFEKKQPSLYCCTKV